MATLAAHPVHARAQAERAVSRQDASSSAEAWLAGFERAQSASDPASLRAIAREGAALGPGAAAALFAAGVAGRPLEARRAAAWLLVTSADARCVRPALALLEEPDPEVRTAVLTFLSSPDLRDAEVEPRVEALGALARDAVDASAAAGAVAALARIDHPASTAVLEGLVEGLSEPIARLAARSLASEPRGRAFVVAAVQEAFTRDVASKPADGVLAELMRAYGTRLAELPQGGTARRDRVPFVLGLRHPSDEVRVMAALAVDRYVARVQDFGDVERARLVLGELVGAGVNDTELLSRIAALLLSESGDPGLALEAARSLRRATDPGTGTIALRQGYADGCLYEGAALLALERPDEAVRALDAAEATLNGLLADRLDLSGSRRLARFAGGVHERLGVAESYRLVADLLRGLAFDDPRVLEGARRLHAQSLEAHLTLLGGDVPTDSVDGVDGLLTHPLGPLALLFRNGRGRLTSDRRLDLELALCRAVATVAPLELPGFERAQPLEPKHTSPLRDKLRNALLARIQNAYYERWNRQIPRELEPYRDDPRRNMLERSYERQLDLRKQEDSNDPGRSRLRMRTAGDLAIAVASRLRDEGRFTAARLMAERIEVDLDASAELQTTGPFYDPYDRDLLRAKAVLTAGNAWMDEDNPGRGEEVMLQALGRFELLETTMREQGDTGANIARARVWQADALVSLAVNANVKLRDPDKALAYFERAHALRSDDFMQVLLACYSARAGRELDAREALRDTPVIPGNYYNLACTYALLGDAATALDFLERDFDEKRGGALQRQREWAREDPDLASLRGEPRFERLVQTSE